MEAAHREAREERRTLLTLDTRRNDAPSLPLLSYVEIGIVPRYSRSAARSLDDAIFFYKELS
jgi:hypothetical protein